MPEQTCGPVWPVKWITLEEARKLYPAKPSAESFGGGVRLIRLWQAKEGA